MVVAKGWSEEEMGTSCLLDVECQFGKTKIFSSTQCTLSILSTCWPYSESDCFEHTTTGGGKGKMGRRQVDQSGVKALFLLIWWEFPRVRTVWFEGIVSREAVWTRVDVACEIILLLLPAKPHYDFSVLLNTVELWINCMPYSTSVREDNCIKRNDLYI